MDKNKAIKLIITFPNNAFKTLLLLLRENNFYFTNNSLKLFLRENNIDNSSKRAQYLHDLMEKQEVNLNDNQFLVLKQLFKRKYIGEDLSHIKSQRDMQLLIFYHPTDILRMTQIEKASINLDEHFLWKAKNDEVVPSDLSEVENRVMKAVDKDLENLDAYPL